MNKTLILASSSPRRRELFRRITADFVCMTADCNEISDADARTTALHNAILKSRAVAATRPDAVVVGCDTVVEMDDKILGKPHDRADAHNMLTLLSGRTHTVYTGVCVSHDGHEDTFIEATDVTFRTLGEDEINAYIDTDEPYDKAGGYGIQDRAALFVTSVHGDYFNIMGLPVCALAGLLRQLEAQKKL